MGLSWSGIKESASSIANKASVAREKIASSKAAGYASDTVAAGYGVGIHTLGGAAMGGTINAAAYADDGHAFTSAESLGSAFVSGAGYGGAAGLGLGLVHARKYAAMNASKRANSKLKQGTMTKPIKPLTEDEKLAEQYSTDNKRSILQMRNLKEKIANTGKDYSSAAVLNQQIQSEASLIPQKHKMANVKDLIRRPAN